MYIYHYQNPRREKRALYHDNPVLAFYADDSPVKETKPIQTTEHDQALRIGIEKRKEREWKQQTRCCRRPWRRTRSGRRGRRGRRW